MRRIIELLLLVLSIGTVVGFPAPLLAQESLHREPEDRALGLYRDLSASLVSEALIREHRNDREGAIFLLERARSVYPDSGEAFFHLARLQPSTRAGRRQQEQLFQHAVNLPLRDISPREIIRGQAELFIEMGRYREAVSLLLPHQDDDEMRHLLVHARLYGGAPWSAGELLRQERMDFPDNMHLARLDYARFPALSLSLLEWIDDAMHRSTAEDAPEVAAVIHELIVNLPRDASELRGVLIPLYYELGGTNHKPRLLRAIDAHPAGDVLSVAEEEELVALLTGAGKKHWEVILAQVGPESDIPLVRAARESLTTGSHRITRDDGHDQTWEEYHLNGGVLQQWIYDRGRNGRADKAAIFPGNGVILFHRAGEDIFRIQYSQYPLVSEVTHFRVHQEGNEESVLVAESRRWRPAQPVPWDAGLQVHNATGAPLFLADAQEQGRFSTDEILGGRVVFDGEVGARFQRQISGPQSTSLAATNVVMMERELRSVEILR